MTVLVTGAAGFIGSHLCEALLEGQREVIGLDAFTEYYDRRLKEQNLAFLRGQERFRFIEADLRAAELNDILDGIEVVFNLAATPGLSLSWQDFDSYESCNFRAVHRLIKACQTTGVRRFVQASTSSIYGSVATGDEDQPTRPVSPYGVTKLAAEHLLGAYHETFGFPVVVLRYFSIYGPRQRPDMAYRIFCERLIAGEPITVFGDGLQTRGNTYVSDCVSATVAALDRGEPGTVLNIGGGSEITLLAAIDILADALGVPPRIDFQPARPGDQRHTKAETSRARRVLDWTPMIEPTDGLRLQAEWIRGAVGGI